MRPGFSTGDPEMAHPPPHPRESLVGSQLSCGKSRHGLGNEPRAMGNGRIERSMPEVIMEASQRR